MKIYLPQTTWEAILITWIFFMALPYLAHAQVCPGNIMLNSQADVNALACTSINGNLTIEGSDIVDLSPLSTITSISGYLTIVNNPLLSDLDGLSGLTSIGSWLVIAYNDALKRVDGLSSLTHIGGALDIRFNPLLENLDGLSGFPTLGGRLWIISNASLKNIDGLSGLQSTVGFVGIDNNDALENLNGLSSLATVGAQVAIDRNDALTDISGLTTLNWVGGFFGLVLNTSLMDCCPLYSLFNYRHVGGTINITGNGAGCTLSDILNCRDRVCTADDFMPGNSTAFAMLLNGIPGVPSNMYSFDSDGGKLEFFNNGTAHLSEKLYIKPQLGYSWDSDVWFINKMDWTSWQALGRTYKGNFPAAHANHTNWDYYEMDPVRSRFIKPRGSAFPNTILNLTPNPPNLSLGFQVGIGANDKNSLYGASSWFRFSGIYSGVGDFNFSLTCNPAPRISAAPIPFHTAINTFLAQDLAPFVTDPGGGSCTFQLKPGTTGPDSGSLNIQSNGQFSYMPNTGFQGVDTFWFQATDAGTPPAFVNGIVEVSVGNAPFPVTWIGFNAKKQGQRSVELTWEVSEEEQADYYQVEKGLDGAAFFEVSKIPATGNQGYNTYSFLDRSQMSSRIYFRLKQVDVDGTFAYSSIVEVNFNLEELRSVKLYPNPVEDHLKIELNEGHYRIRILDVTGRIMRKEFVQIGPISETVWQVGDLSPGMYILEATNGKGNTISGRFWKR